MLTLRGIALSLGGEVNGSFVIAPGPNHSKHDRSLKVVLSSKGENGFLVHSFSGDDWKTCRDYVNDKLGLTRKQYPDKAKVHIHKPSSISPEQARYAKARELWHAARTDDLRRHLRLVYPDLFKDEAAWAEAFRLSSLKA